MAHYGNLDSLDSLTALVNKLPLDMRRRWVRKSVEIEANTRSIARFRDLVAFVETESNEANSLFGLRSLNLNTSKGSIQRTSKPKVSSYNISASSRVSPRKEPKRSETLQSCWFCKSSNHKILSCPDFRRLDVTDRHKFVKSLKLCCKCLSSKHRTPQCKKSNTCEVEDCKGGYHHTILHRSIDKKQQSNDVSTSTDDIHNTLASSVPETSKQIVATSSCEQGLVYFCVVPVIVSCENKEVITYAFLDQGSTSTFCDRTLIEKLDVTGTKENISLRTLTGSSKRELGVSFKAKVRGLDNDQCFEIPKVLSINKIPVKPNTVTPQVRSLSHLQDVSFGSVYGAHVGLLIGADMPELFCNLEVRKGQPGEPIAIHTPLGWSLLGPSTQSSSQTCETFFVSHTTPVKDMVECLWKTDFEEGTSVIDGLNSREDRIAYQTMKNSIQLVQGHYQLPLLWKQEARVLPNNYLMPKRRSMSLKKRLLSDESLRYGYVKAIEQYVSKGYAEQAPDEVGSKGQWYLPHFPVIHPSKPGKVRVVFDCSAKFGKISLNDCLMQGPQLTNTLIGVLTRFRKEPVALIGDIEAMFHQVKVHPSCYDVLRFLWWPLGDLKGDPIAYQMRVHVFGAASSPACANFSLRQVAKDFGHQFPPITGDIVNHNFYVDDCLLSFPSSKDAIRVRQNLVDLLAKAGFHLTKWKSNSAEVLETIPEEQRAKNTSVHTIDVSANAKVLGVHWNLKDDNFVVSVNLPSCAHTKRGILSVLNSLYDPLGFVAPVILEPKLMLQSLCKSKLSWDDKVPEEETEKWQKWLASLNNLQSLSIPRCFKPAGFQSIQLIEIHNFADASSYAYGACSYLRLVDANGNISCSFLLGKSRLAPIKKVSVPRLELTAAVVAVRLDVLLRQELDLSSSCSFYWTDSLAVLQSIKNRTKRFPVFVANRLSIIENNSDINHWKHVPSKLNPADLPSRGVSAQTLINSDVWLRGPQFLYEPRSCWPENSWVEEDLPDEFKAVQKSLTCTSKVKVHAQNDVVFRLIERCSSFYKLKCLVAWILRMKSFFRTRVRDSDVSFSSSRLTVEELSCAEISIVKYVQISQFPEFFSSQKSGSSHKHSSLIKLNPCLINGVLRVGGRLDKVPLNLDVKHPIILPRHSHLTELVIRQHHELVGHSGTGHTWASIRQKYWIVKGSAAVRHTLGQCVSCKKRNAKVGEQLMADLPECRSQIHKDPFSHVRVDYCGPFLVKQGRSMVKRYCCVFTCLTIRAIHIEVAHTLSTESFIEALRRFIARRGRPEQIYSDNGTNFIGAQRVLRELLESWNQGRIEEFLRQQHVKWRFNPPTASHMGGAWERMIRSMRRILGALIQSQALNDENFLTLLAEVEGIINSRPLVPVTFEPHNEEPLTANHLLLLRGNPALPPGEFSGNKHNRRWMQVQHMADQFWSRWVKEFLPHLINRQKWFQTKRNVKLNDIVLLVEDSQHRSKWRMGRVVETFPDRKGIVRTVLVKTQFGVIKRPITKLCLIIE